MMPIRTVAAYPGTGSLEYQKNSSGTRIELEFVYTPANLLSSVTHDDVSGAPASAMTWDADSNRISFTSSEDSGMTKFVYDTTAGIPAVIGEVWPDDFWAGYIREPNGALIASAMYPGDNPVSNVQPQGKDWWDGVKDKLKGWWPWGKPDKDSAKQYLKNNIKNQVTKMLRPPFNGIAKQLDKVRGAGDKRDKAMGEVKNYAEDMRNDNMDNDYRVLSCIDACIALFDYLGVTTGARETCADICDECNP